MQTFAKKPLHWAVAAALTGLGSAAPLGEVLAQDTNVGQALVFPYYTVNNNWVTTFKAINTSDKTLAVKIRFHESKNSRDVLDFNIIMSPYDVWSGWLQDSDAGPQLFTSDETCTSPEVVSGVHASRAAYTGEFDDTGGQGLGRMREGYIEMLVMGVAPSGWEDETALDANNVNRPVYPTAYYAKHVDGVPRDCEKVDQSFYPEAPSWKNGQNPLAIAPDDAAANWCATNVHPANSNPPPAIGSGWPFAACSFTAPADNNATFPLKGNLTWLHALTGTGAGTEAIAVGEDAETIWSVQNYVTAQLFPWFLEPTFATNQTNLWTVDGVGAFEQTILFAGTLNEWADNPKNGAAIDWVVNFPTKGYHVDWFNEQIQAAYNRYRTGVPTVDQAVVTSDGNPALVGAPEAIACNNDRTDCAPISVGPASIAPFEYLFGEQGDGDSKVTVTYDLWNSEEGGESIGSTTISPTPPGEISSLRWEANVLQFATEPVLDSPKAVEIDASAKLDGAPNGWTRLEFQANLPLVGFAIKERDLGDPATNYGQAMDNGYIPPVPEVQ